MYFFLKVVHCIYGFPSLILLGNNNLKNKIMKNMTKYFSAITMMIGVLGSSSSFGQNPKLTDPEIASVAVTANQIDINYAKIAKEKSKNDDVLKFAATMTTDHQSVIDQAVALCKKLGVTPKDNDVSKNLNAGAVTTTKTLRDKTGDVFNKAYIDNEVAYHKAVIETVDNVLIPQTQNADLKALLVKVSPILKSHLEHAQMIQKMLTK
jgi:putative membrane protein